MHGNVYEWCLDWYQTKLGTNEVTDPPGVATDQNEVTDPPGVATDQMNRVTRGGSWGDNANTCRSAFRYYGTPNYANEIIGFRLSLPAGK